MLKYRSSIALEQCSSERIPMHEREDRKSDTSSRPPSNYTICNAASPPWAVSQRAFDHRNAPALRIAAPVLPGMAYNPPTLPGRTGGAEKACGHLLGHRLFAWSILLPDLKGNGNRVVRLPLLFDNRSSHCDLVIRFQRQEQRSRSGRRRAGNDPRSTPQSMLSVRSPAPDPGMVQFSVPWPSHKTRAFDRRKLFDHYSVDPCCADKMRVQSAL